MGTEEQWADRFELAIVASTEPPTERAVGGDETAAGAAERAIGTDPEEGASRKYRDAT